MKDYLIREGRQSDAGALLSIYAWYVEHTAVSFEWRVPELAAFRLRLAEVATRYPFLVVEEERTLTGFAYASAFHARAAYDWCVETSIYLAPSARRRGLGTALYRVLEALLVEQGVLSLYACIAFKEMEDEYLSDASVRFHEQCGFVPAAHFHNCGFKFGRWYDVVWMEKLVGRRTDSCAPLIPCPDLAGKDEIIAIAARQTQPQK